MMLHDLLTYVKYSELQGIIVNNWKEADVTHF